MVVMTVVIMMAPMIVMIVMIVMITFVARMIAGAERITLIHIRRSGG